MEVKDKCYQSCFFLLVTFMPYLSSRCGTKIALEELENKKKGTSSMFFDLEKWLTILKDLEEYPKI